MGKQRPLPEDAEVVYPQQGAGGVLVDGGRTVKSLSASFLADVEAHWRVHGQTVLDKLVKSHPATYFNGMVSLSRVVRWELDHIGVFDRSLSPEQIMDKLEERVGPRGRDLFEQFLRQVNQLQLEQRLEEHRARGGEEGSG